MANDLQMIPSFRTIVVGIRDPQERKVYPLSWSDTRKIQNLVYYCFAKVADSQIKDPVAIYNFIFETIYENLVFVANLVIEGDEITGEELSAAQATELANIVYDMNFEIIVKNLQSLLQKASVLMEKAEKKG
jgi:hypothetical protein